MTTSLERVGAQRRKAALGLPPVALECGVRQATCPAFLAR